MKTAIITGIAGQDGSYLAELLTAKGYSVVGTSRNPDNAVSSLPPSLLGKVEVIKWHPADQASMVEMLSAFQPEEFYNLAAMSSGSGMFDAPDSMGDVNGLAVTRILEAIRISSPATRFCQASSSEIFGAAIHSPQSEDTPARPRSPYGAAKAYADMMVRIYRRHHGLFACSAILFNHESPRRRFEFVTRKVTRGASMIKRGLVRELGLGNLESMRDWGFAGDYVLAMWLSLQQAEADDYVVATGIQHSVRTLCECAFSHLGLDYREYVRTDASTFRAAETAPLIGDPTRANRILGWRPRISFSEMIGKMVDADLQVIANQTDTRAVS